MPPGQGPLNISSRLQPPVIFLCWQTCYADSHRLQAVNYWALLLPIVRRLPPKSRHLTCFSHVIIRCWGLLCTVTCVHLSVKSSCRNLQQISLQWQRTLKYRWASKKVAHLLPSGQAMILQTLEDASRRLDFAVMFGSEKKYCTEIA